MAAEGFRAEGPTGLAVQELAALGPRFVAWKMRPEKRGPAAFACIQPNPRQTSETAKFP